MTYLEAAFANAIEYREKLSSAVDRPSRLRLLSDAPLFSLWHDVRLELKEAASEIEALKARIRALEGEDA